MCACVSMCWSTCQSLCVYVHACKDKKKHGLEKAMATENNTDCNGLIC